MTTPQWAIDMAEARHPLLNCDDKKEYMVDEIIYLQRAAYKEGLEARNELGKGFAEWCNANFWKGYVNPTGYKWQYGPNREMTTDELFEIFIKSNRK